MYTTNINTPWLSHCYPKDTLACQCLLCDLTVFPPKYHLSLSQLSLISAATINMDPINRSAVVGEWVTFSCNIDCSTTLSDIVIWFVNGSSLMSIQDDGIMHKTIPLHSYCSNPEGFNSELSLRTNRVLDNPINIHCAIVSVCDLNSNCTTTACFSEDAYLQGNLPWYIIIYSITDRYNSNSTLVVYFTLRAYSFFCIDSTVRW